MAWFSKKTKRIESVPPEERVVKTENVFVKCDGCEAHLFKGELEDGLQVCKHCGYHFRIGAREHPSEDQPLVVGTQFNPAGMWQRVERLTDSFAQALGLWLIVVGTVLASYGDVLFAWLWPLECAA